MVLYAVVAAILAFGPVLTLAALLQKTPELGLVVTPRTAIGYGFPAALVYLFFGALVGFIVGPLAGIPCMIVIAMIYTSRKTVLPDVVRARRLAHLVGAGKHEQALALADGIAKDVRRFDASHVTARATLAAAAQVATFDLERGEAIATKVEGLPFGGEIACQVAHALAIYRIAQRRYAEAARTIGVGSPAPPTPMLLDQRDLLLARIDAATGHGERALERAAKRESDEWESVRAHAFASLSRIDEARAALETLRAARGDSYLREIVIRQGPASALAAAILGDDDHPYR